LEVLHGGWVIAACQVRRLRRRAKKAGHVQATEEVRAELGPQVVGLGGNAEGTQTPLLGGGEGGVRVTRGGGTNVNQRRGAVTIDEIGEAGGVVDHISRL